MYSCPANPRLRLVHHIVSFLDTCPFGLLRRRLFSSSRASLKKRHPRAHLSRSLCAALPCGFGRGGVGRVADHRVVSRVDVFREVRQGFVQLQRGDLALGGCQRVSTEEEEEEYTACYAPGMIDAPFRVDSNGGGGDTSLAWVILLIIRVTR